MAESAVERVVIDDIEVIRLWDGVEIRRNKRYIWLDNKEWLCLLELYHALPSDSITFELLAPSRVSPERCAKPQRGTFVGYNSWNDVSYFDIRRWFWGGSVYVPTKEGVKLRAGQFRQLVLSFDASGNVLHT